MTDAGKARFMARYRRLLAVADRYMRMVDRISELHDRFIMAIRSGLAFYMTTLSDAEIDVLVDVQEGEHPARVESVRRWSDFAAVDLEKMTEAAKTAYEIMRERADEDRAEDEKEKIH